MAKKNLIDEAYRRGRILNGILLQARERAKSNPLDPKWVEIGLVGSGETRAEASRVINETFDDLSEYIAHIIILDMSASFEQSSRSRLTNHIGESRKRIKSATKNDTLPSYREKLVRNLDDFEGLYALWSLLEGSVGVEMTENFKAIRDARNKVAHGSRESGPPKIDMDVARQTLEDLFKLI